MEAFEPDNLGIGPNWASKLVEVLQPVSARADRLGSMGVFSGLSRAELEFAAGILRETLIERGARMTVQGQPSPFVWLLLEGDALVSADARPIRVVGHGDFVGLAGMPYPIASPETTIALSPIRASKPTGRCSRSSSSSLRSGSGSLPPATRVSQAAELGAVREGTPLGQSTCLANHSLSVSASCQAFTMCLRAAGEPSQGCSPKFLYA